MELKRPSEFFGIAAMLDKSFYHGGHGEHGESKTYFKITPSLATCFLRALRG
jgi:hypothetical protein